jgi:hypothetical protein
MLPKNEKIIKRIESKFSHKKFKNCDDALDFVFERIAKNKMFKLHQWGPNLYLNCMWLALSYGTKKELGPYIICVHLIQTENVKIIFKMYIESDQLAYVDCPLDLLLLTHLNPISPLWRQKVLAFKKLKKDFLEMRVGDKIFINNKLHFFVKWSCDGEGLFKCDGKTVIWRLEALHYIDEGVNRSEISYKIAV